VSVIDVAGLPPGGAGQLLAAIFFTVVVSAGLALFVLGVGAARTFKA
jgi:hypothetical protein